MSNPKDLVGAKKAPMDLVPAAGAIMSAPAHQNGSDKYGPFNWRQNPVQLMTYLAAIRRHMDAFVDGQDLAEDTGIHHLSHMLAGMNIIADALALGNLIDNRPPKGPAADMLRAQDKSAKTFSTDPDMQRGLDGVVAATRQMIDDYNKGKMTMAQALAAVGLSPKDQDKIDVDRYVKPRYVNAAVSYLATAPGAALPKEWLMPEPETDVSRLAAFLHPAFKPQATQDFCTFFDSESGSYCNRTLAAHDGVWAFGHGFYSRLPLP